MKNEIRKQLAKAMSLLLIAVMSLTVVACGSDNKTEEQAEQQTSQLQEDVENLEQDYRNYAENMGINVDEAMKEAGY